LRESHKKKWHASDAKKLALLKLVQRGTVCEDSQEGFYVTRSMPNAHAHVIMT